MSACVFSAFVIKPDEFVQVFGISLPLNKFKSIQIMKLEISIVMSESYFISKHIFCIKQI